MCIRDSNKTGGLKVRHSKFVNILEKNYGMGTKYDDGRKICFKKNYPNGELNIGLKLEFDNTKVIFSEFLNNNGTNVKGKNVTYYEFDDKILEKSINTSIENLPINTTSKSIESSKKYSSEWKDFITQSENENFIDEYVENLFIKDDINPRKFLGNFQYKKMGFSQGFQETKSMSEILFTGIAFTDYFVSAYPDVYLWAQKNGDRVKAYQNLDENEDDYFDYIENLIPFYRKIINQYKQEGNKLECA